MVDYSIKFNNINEDKNVFRYSTDSKTNRVVILRVYNTYLNFKEYEETIKLSPNTNYWTFVPCQLNHRYVEFRDGESLEVVGLFGLDSLFKIENFDNFNYVKNIFNELETKEKDNVYFVFNEISMRKTYHNDFVSVEENDLIVDIGFNYGLFSLESLKYKPSKIIAFEPNPKLITTFKKFISDDTIELHQKAVSNQNGNTVFHEKENPGLSSIFEEINNNHLGNSYQVETISFYDFIINNNVEKIDYLKVDCEGAEYGIFDSIPYEYLTKNIEKIAIEFHHKIDDSKVQNLINKLKQCGFSLKIRHKKTESIGMIYGKK